MDISLREMFRAGALEKRGTFPSVLFQPPPLTRGGSPSFPQSVEPMPDDRTAAAFSNGWTLTLPGDIRLMGCVRTFMEAICHLAQLDADIVSTVVLCTHEAVSNVIQHTYRSQPQAVLHIRCSIGEAGVEVRLDDNGQPFAIQQVPHLDPAEVRTGGRGVFLIRTLMDEVSTEVRQEGGNTLRMFKRR